MDQKADESTPYASHHKRGSTLIMVLIMTAALSMVAASLLRLGGAERRMNESHFNHTQAQNAAETMVEYGFAELKARWERQTSFPMNSLRSDPLAIPTTAQNFYDSSGIDFDNLNLVGGDVPPGEWLFIDPDDPSNVNDPQKGKLVFSRGVEIFGKAVVSDPVIGQRTAHCSQVLLVRDAPLFSHAIFYNMDLEFHPGPQMEMQGPVHANGDIYVQAVNRLRFHSTLNSSGDLIYGSKSKGGDVTQTGSVQVKDITGAWVSFYKGGDTKSPSSYYDSRLGDDWRETATDRWGGNVSTSEHGVRRMNAVGINDYVPDDPSTPENEKYNPSYALIEPVVATTDPNFKGDAVQEQQLAYKAGLIFKVTQVADASAPKGYNYEVNAYRYDRESALEPKSAPRTTDGLPDLVDLNLADVEARIGKSLIDVNLYEQDGSGTPTGGFYDQRQEVQLDVIEMDIGVLTELIDTPVAAGGGSDAWDGSYRMNPSTAVDWNGVVYVELPYDSSPSTRADRVMPAARNVALRLRNAKDIPNPAFTSISGYDEGFTLATNGQLYVKGHFNSDGLSSTGSSTETDDGVVIGSVEPPASLFADAITILSNNFTDSKSKLSPSQRTATYTEVSAALVTGLLPTIPGVSGGHSSGGAHNLPRFLEKWSSKEFRYRGSLVALYESEAGYKPMTSSFSSWYSPPIRNWGFNDLFASGFYPPGTPNVRDFRRTDFRFMTETEYNAALEGLDGFSFGSSGLGHDANSCSSTGG